MGAIARTYCKLRRSFIITGTVVTLLLPFKSALAANLDVEIVGPGESTRVTSPFNVQASSANCSGQPVAAMGYSMDDSTHTEIFQATSIYSLALASAGNHTLHVKSWGEKGAACASDVNITVSDDAPVPPEVTVAGNLQRLPNWVGGHDPGTYGAASGSSILVKHPSISSQAREYKTNFEANGGERYYTSFGADSVATHFIYDAQLWLSSNVGIGNIEMDLNQVMANGQTVIYGIQCDGYHKTWDYTLNTGTPARPYDSWVPSNVACDPSAWTPQTWHHIQIAYSRDSAGNVTYHSITLDGVKSDFVGASGNSAFALGWSPTLLTNLQFDGRGAAGTITAYLDNLTIYRW